MARDVVSAYTLILGDEYGPTRSACTPPRRRHGRPWTGRSGGDASCGCGRGATVDPEATGRLADAWRAGNPEERFWQILSHQLAVRIPEIGRQRVAAQPALARR